MLVSATLPFKKFFEIISLLIKIKGSKSYYFDFTQKNFSIIYEENGKQTPMLVIPSKDIENYKLKSILGFDIDIDKLYYEILDKMSKIESSGYNIFKIKIWLESEESDFKFELVGND